MSVNQEYLDDLEKYLNKPDDIEEPLEEDDTVKGLAGNVTTDEVRDTKQALLYLVVDKSSSMHYNGLEKGVIDGLNDVKQTVNGSKESKCIQTAMTFFGSTLDMRPFQYGEHIDINYEANGGQTRLYDAIVESCNNMISQYDSLKGAHDLKGVMLIFTDGEENCSKQYNLRDVRDALAQLKKRKIKYLVAALEGTDLAQLGDDLCVEPILIKDQHQLRRLMQFASKSVS